MHRKRSEATASTVAGGGDASSNGSGSLKDVEQQNGNGAEPELSGDGRNKRWRSYRYCGAVKIAAVVVAILIMCAPLYAGLGLHDEVRLFRADGQQANALLPVGGPETSSGAVPASIDKARSSRDLTNRSAATTTPQTPSKNDGSAPKSLLEQTTGGAKPRITRTVGADAKVRAGGETKARMKTTVKTPSKNDGSAPKSLLEQTTGGAKPRITRTVGADAKVRAGGETKARMKTTVKTPSKNDDSAPKSLLEHTTGGAKPRITRTVGADAKVGAGGETKARMKTTVQTPSKNDGSAPKSLLEQTTGGAKPRITRTVGADAKVRAGGKTKARIKTTVSGNAKLAGRLGGEEVGGEKVWVLHILKKHKDSRRPTRYGNDGVMVKITDTKEKAAEDLKNILAILKNKDYEAGGKSLRATFEEMAKKESDCASAKNGGDLGFFGRGKMHQPFEEAAFGLNVGELSGIVESPSGVHAILRIG